MEACSEIRAVNAVVPAAFGVVDVLAFRAVEFHEAGVGDVVLAHW